MGLPDGGSNSGSIGLGLRRCGQGYRLGFICVRVEASSVDDVKKDWVWREPRRITMKEQRRLRRCSQRGRRAAGRMASRVEAVERREAPGLLRG